MKKLRLWATVTLTLAILGLVVLFFSFAALSDIQHGDGDVNLEWGFLRLGFLVILLLIVVTIIYAGLFLKYIREKDEREKPRTDRTPPA